MKESEKGDGPPSPAQVAEMVARSMAAGDPMDPIGWATALDSQRRPVYLVAIVMEPNVEDFTGALEKLRPRLKPTKLPDEPSGESGESR